MWSNSSKRVWAPVLFVVGGTSITPDFIQPFKVEVDASIVGAGPVLLQEDEKRID